MLTWIKPQKQKAATSSDTCLNETDRLMHLQGWFPLFHLERLYYKVTLFTTLSTTMFETLLKRKDEWNCIDLTEFFLFWTSGSFPFCSCLLLSELLVRSLIWSLNSKVNSSGSILSEVNTLPLTIQERVPDQPWLAILTQKHQHNTNNSFSAEISAFLFLSKNFVADFLIIFDGCQSEWY